MGIIFHRKPHGGRYDDPHGVTAGPTRPQNTNSKSGPTSRLPSDDPYAASKTEGPPAPTKRVKISSEPSAPTKESRKASKKSQKAIEKSGINDPTYRAESAKRGVQYKQVKDQESRRLKREEIYGLPEKPEGDEKRFLESGFRDLGKPPEI